MIISSNFESHILKPREIQAREHPGAFKTEQEQKRVSDLFVGAADPFTIYFKLRNKSP